jgi:hypothetical protein
MEHEQTVTQAMLPGILPIRLGSGWTENAAPVAILQFRAVKFLAVEARNAMLPRIPMASPTVLPQAPGTISYKNTPLP